MQEFEEELRQDAARQRQKRSGMSMAVLEDGNIRQTSSTLQVISQQIELVGLAKQLALQREAPQRVAQ